MDRYTVLNELAATRTGQVLLCADRQTGATVVVKRVQVQFVNVGGHGAADPSASIELQVHRKLCENGGHRHILQLLNDFSADGSEYFVLEHCRNGELFDHVENAPDRRLDPSLVQTYFGHICSAVQFMHAQGFAHCDLSLENVLVDAHGNLKLSDFGLATALHTCRQNLVGKPFYMAPEMHLMDAYDPAKADVWSLGVMLFILLTGSPPFEVAHESDASMQFIATKGCRGLCHAWQLENVIPPAAMDLLEKMLVINPVERWSLGQVAAHAYVVESTSAKTCGDVATTSSRKSSLVSEILH
ncbi:hypothetical protein AC1031_018261 [Aphanomyces cochlioides]|nr:hypothetical protein AC1031_018261 [Aphanomyces cochlioides]